MSKNFRIFLLVLTASVQILHLFNNASGQDLEITIKLDASQPQIVNIEGKKLNVAGRTPRRNLSFLTSTAGVDVSGERVSNLKLLDAKGSPISYKRFIPGEYLAEADFDRWSYRVDLAAPKNQTLMARVSWVSGNAGILMLDDLLPQFGKSENVKSAKIVFEKPFDPAGPGFDSFTPIYTSEKKIDSDTFLVPDIASSVFFVGRDWTCGALPGAPPPGNLCSLGERQFTYKEAADMIIEIYGHYRKLFGMGHLEVTVAIVKFPGKTDPGTWKAETRGTNTTIFSSDMPFKSQSLQKLHEQLRHELFHLWIPNGISLSGNYDWFYEGFALYQALKTGVAMNRIRFDDFLDTLSRAYNIDDVRGRKLSLVEASKNRWNGSNTQVYARGMLVAFLCDLALLERSNGKSSVADVVRALFEKHRLPGERMDGNAAVLEILRSHAELGKIIDKNILGTEKIDWGELLKAAGIEAVEENSLLRLRVAAKPTGRQKDLLDRLGYNSWRKLS